MSAHHQEQLNAELPEDREVRLENLHRNRESGYGPQLALLEQDSVQQRMRKFHEEMSSIGTPTCSTCMEGFPGTKMVSHSTECQRCSRDRSTPKLYSLANNADPGPIPQELQVSNICICPSVGMQLSSCTICHHMVRVIRKKNQLVIR